MEEIEPKFQLNDPYRIADLKKTFAKYYTTNWSYRLYEISEIVNDTIPNYRLDNLPERHNGALLKKQN